MLCFSEQRRQSLSSRRQQSRSATPSEGRTVSILRRTLLLGAPSEPNAKQQQEEIEQRRQERRAFRSLSRSLAAADMSQGPHTRYPDLVAALDSLLKVIEAEERDEAESRGCVEGGSIDDDQSREEEFGESGLVISDVRGGPPAVKILRGEEIVAAVKPRSDVPAPTDSETESGPQMKDPFAKDSSEKCVEDRLSNFWSTVQLVPKEEMSQNEQKTENLDAVKPEANLIRPEVNTMKAEVDEVKVEVDVDAIPQLDVSTKVRSRKSSIVKRIPREKAKSLGSSADIGSLPKMEDTIPNIIKEQQGPAEATSSSRLELRNLCVTSSELLTPPPHPPPQQSSVEKRKRKGPIVEYFILTDPNKKMVDKNVKNGEEKLSKKTLESPVVIEKASDKKRKSMGGNERDDSAMQTKKRKQEVVVEDEVIGWKWRGETGTKNVGKGQKTAKKQEAKEESKANKKMGVKPVVFHDPKLVHVVDFNPYAKKAKSFRRPRGGQAEATQRSDEAFRLEVEHNRKVALLGRIQFSSFLSDIYVTFLR